MKKFSNEQVEEEFEKYTKNVTENDVNDILGKRDDILNKSTGALEKFAENIKLLFSIIDDYAKGNYKGLPWTTIAFIIAALIYIFVPIDIIPDFIPVFGLIDDAAVISLCLKAIGVDLKKYKKWKEEQVGYKINTNDDYEYEQMEDEDESLFFMEIQDAYNIYSPTMSSTVAVGKIIHGVIKTNNKVGLTGEDYDDVYEVTINEIRINNDLSDKAEAGDIVRLRFKELFDEGEVKKGDYLI